MGMKKAQSLMRSFNFTTCNDVGFGNASKHFIDKACLYN